MKYAVSENEHTAAIGIIDQSSIANLCAEIDATLRKHKNMGIFTFLYRYFQTLLQQERLKELQTYIETIEQYSFSVYTDSVRAFIGYIKALLLQSQGKTKEAAYWFRQTLAKHTELETLCIKNVRVNCYKELGSMDFHQERYEDAIENYQMAINSLTLDEDSEYLLAILMYNMALCKYFLKNYYEALECLDKVIPLAKDTSNSYLLLNALTLKAALLSDTFKNYLKSNEILNQAYEIAQRNQHTTLINRIWNNWGHNFFHLEQYLLAEQALQYSIRLSYESGDLEAGLYSEIGLAKIWIKQGRTHEAKQLLKHAKERAFKELKSSYGLLDCFELLEQIENNDELRKKYLEEAYRLACEHNNYQKSTKFQKKLSEMSPKKKEF